jgi:hypothetical protein
MKLPDHFINAVALHCFSNFAIALDGEAYFAVKDRDGKLHSFKSDPETLNKVALELTLLAQHAERMASRDHSLAKRPSLDFETHEVGVCQYEGEDASGYLDFWFFTPAGTIFRTILGPNLTVRLLYNCYRALASLPRPPSIIPGVIPGTLLPGDSTSASNTITFFGQRYPTDIVSALGVLMIRANLLDQLMIDLLSALSDLTREKAHALFFSTANMKARIDMLRSLGPLVTLTENELEQLSDILDRISNVSERRNTLVHGSWRFRKDKFRVRTYKTAATEKSRVKTIYVTAKLILGIASDYRALGISIRMFCDTRRMKAKHS